MRILSLMFLLLAFVSFITSVLIRFIHTKLVPHYPMTLLQAAALFLLFSIALSLLHMTRESDDGAGSSGEDA